MLFKCSLSIKAWKSSAALLPSVWVLVSVDNRDFCFPFLQTLYPHCAVLNISRHIGKVMQLSWRAKHSVLPGIVVSSIKCYHQCWFCSLFCRVERCMPSHSFPLSCWRRLFKEETGCSVGAEGAVLVDRTRGTSNPPALPKSIKACTLQPCFLLAQSVS